VEISWFIATWFEILGALGLVIGLFTRFWAASLIILTCVAILGVHMPAEWNGLGELWESYRVTRKEGSGNFRIPLLFMAMLVPLVLNGAGRLSVDNLLSKRLAK
jgi:putative oxidoreductase